MSTRLLSRLRLEHKALLRKLAADMDGLEWIARHADAPRNRKDKARMALCCTAVYLHLTLQELDNANGGEA